LAYNYYYDNQANICLVVSFAPTPPTQGPRKAGQSQETGENRGKAPKKGKRGDFLLFFVDTKKGNNKRVHKFAISENSLKLEVIKGTKTPHQIKQDQINGKKNHEPTPERRTPCFCLVV